MGLPEPEKFSGDTQGTRMRTLDRSRTGQCHRRKRALRIKHGPSPGQAGAQCLSNRVGSWQCPASSAHTAETHGQSCLFLFSPCVSALASLRDYDSTRKTCEAWWTVCALSRDLAQVTPALSPSAVAVRSGFSCQKSLLWDHTPLAFLSFS